MMAENVEGMGGLPSMDNQGPDAGLALQQPRSVQPTLSKGIKKRVKKCPHGRQKSRCTDCGGKVRAKCPHGKQKSVCADCGGIGLCQHGRRKIYCTECGDGRVPAKKCPHGRQKSRCADCGGGGLCQHGRRKGKCIKCQTMAEIAGLDVSKIMSCGLAPRLMERPTVQAITPRLLTRHDSVT